MGRRRAFAGSVTTATVLPVMSMRSRKGLKLSPQSFGQMMRNPIYVGRVESPDYDVSTKGNFEPLVGEATFYRAQGVLDGRIVVAGPRQRNNPDFPLRGFVRCEPCARALLDSVKGHRLAAVISVATAIGLRLGETLGLRWIDVDFDGTLISVRQALERSGGDSAARRPLIAERREMLKRLAATPKRSAERREIRRQLGELRIRWRAIRTTLHTTEPKSIRSGRTIRMPGVVVQALKAHRTRQLEDRLTAGGAWEDSGLVFASPIGTALDPRNVTKEFQAMLSAAKLPQVRVHDLRHTAATLLLAQGVDPRTIMETLVHSQTSLTLNTNSHVLPALQAEAAAKMDAILSGA